MTTHEREEAIEMKTAMVATLLSDLSPEDARSVLMMVGRRVPELVDGEVEEVCHG